MPYKAKAPIVAKIDGQQVRFGRGESVTPEQAKVLLKTHAHVLIRVPHTSFNCKKTCTHHSHPWNQTAEAAAPAAAPAAKPAPAAKTTEAK